MIEYVLILIITVTLLFLAKGVFSGLNTYMTSYIGGYFKCLMVQGELPALGVTDTDLSKHTGAGYKCSLSYEKSNLASQAGGSGGTKNLGTTTQLSSTKPQGSTKETAARRGVSSSTSSSSKKAAANKRKGQNSDFGDSGDEATRFSSIRNRSDAYSSSDAEASEGSQTTFIPTRNLEPDRSEAYRPITGRLEESLKQNTRGGGIDRRLNSSKIMPIPSDDMRPGPRRTKFMPPQRSVAASAEEPETEMGFGYFLKWIMIAGIGIAIFIFFGGQIMNYNNSDN